MDGKLHHASLRVRYWKIVLTERRIKVSQATVLWRLVAEIWLGETAPLIPHSTRILQNVATAAQRALRRVRRHAVKERENCLQELKARLALRIPSQATDVDAAIKTIDRQLTEGCCFRRLPRS
jgi:hypothetical protein